MRMLDFSAFAAIEMPENQAAPADRDEQRIEVRSLVEDLERNRPLTSDDVGVGERVDIGEALGFSMLQGRPIAVIPDLTRYHHTRSPRVELGNFFGGYGPG